MVFMILLNGLRNVDKWFSVTYTKKLNHLNWFHSLYDRNKSEVSLLLLWKSGYHITKYKTSAGLFHAKFLLWSQPLLGMLYQVWWWWIKSIVGVYDKFYCLLLFMSLRAACVIWCVGVYSCHCDMAQKPINKDNYFNKWIFGKSKDVDQK